MVTIKHLQIVISVVNTLEQRPSLLVLVKFSYESSFAARSEPQQNKVYS